MTADFAIADSPNAEALGPTSRASGEGAEAQRESDCFIGTPLTRTQARRRARLMYQWREARTPGTESWMKVRRIVYGNNVNMRRYPNAPKDTLRQVLDSMPEGATFTSATIYERIAGTRAARWLSRDRIHYLLRRHQKEYGIVPLPPTGRAHALNLWRKVKR